MRRYHAPVTEDLYGDPDSPTDDARRTFNAALLQAALICRQRSSVPL
jgi:hypothetical protein